MCALLGLIVGSFLNVVIYRVPRHESIVSPRSKCPSCESPILERDNVPVLSWLLLRGKCRNCRAPISARYPLVELATAMLFTGAAARQGWNWELPAFLVMLASLLALSCIDVEMLLLPLRIVYPTFLLMSALFVLAAGRYAVLGFFLANLIGAVIGIALIATKRMSRDQQIPYGVFLALGAGVAIYAGPEILAPFASLHW